MLRFRVMFMVRAGVTTVFRSRVRAGIRSRVRCEVRFRVRSDVRFNVRFNVKTDGKTIIKPFIVCSILFLIFPKFSKAQTSSIVSNIIQYNNILSSCSIIWFYH